MKRKRTTTNAQVPKPNAKFTSAYRAPRLGKNTWNIVDSFLLPKNENKFNEIHKSFSQFPTKYENISDHIKGRLFETGPFGWNWNVNWLFFKHFETDKIFAENVNEKNRLGWTALHYAAQLDEVEIAKAVIKAGVDIDAKSRFGITALHDAAIRNRLKIGQVLIEAGARLNIKYRNKTALEFAVYYNSGGFAEMLRKKMANI